MSKIDNLEGEELDFIDGEAFDQETYDAFESKIFTKKFFQPLDALSYSEMIDGVSYKTWVIHGGGGIDEENHKIIPDGWDHEHCAICGLTINAGDEYLDNAKGDILCFECEKYYRENAARK